MDHITKCLVVTIWKYLPYFKTNYQTFGFSDNKKRLWEQRNGWPVEWPLSVCRWRPIPTLRIPRIWCRRPAPRHHPTHTTPPSGSATCRTTGNTLRTSLAWLRKSPLLFIIKHCYSKCLGWPIQFIMTNNFKKQFVPS